MNSQIKQALKVLKEGGVIAYPTDTTYGIGCDISNDSAVQNIFKIKGRDFNKPMSVAFADLKMLREYTKLNGISDEFLGRVFPGPVTLLLSKGEKISDLITAGSSKVGSRIPDHKEVLDLIASLGCPIITTSANISGQSDPVTADEVKLPVDFIFRGECKHKMPSTIIDTESKSVVRPGVNVSHYQSLISHLDQ